MKKILVIDDDKHLRSDLLEMLAFEGYDPVEAENGHEGLLCAQAHQPDLIICDIAMPVLDGFGVIAALREEPRTADIPVIFLSARTAQEHIQTGTRLGAIAYLPKPYQLKDLLFAIRTHIGD